MISTRLVAPVLKRILIAVYLIAFAPFALGLNVLQAVAADGGSATSQTLAQGLSPPGAGAGLPPVPVNTQAVNRVVSLRSAVRNGLVQFQLTGDGVTTAHVHLLLTNNADQKLRVLIPAHEVFRPNSANIQMMMTTTDKILSLPAQTTVSVDIPTVCASVKSIKPPGKEGTSFEVGRYPDEDTWKELVSILAAAQQLSKEGAYEHLLTKRESRQATIGQLAIWMLLGKRTGRSEDAVTKESIGNEMLDQMNLKRQQLSPDKLERFDKGVDEIFLATDITLKRSKAFKDQVTLPQDSSFDTFKQVGERAFDGGDYVTAEELLAAASSEALAFGETDSRYLGSLNKVADCYMEEGKFDQASTVLNNALTIENKAGAQSSEAGETLTFLGLVNLAQKKYSDASSNLTQAVSVREKSQGSESTPLAETLNALGQLYVAQEQYSDAEATFRRALAIQYKNAGAKSMAVAECDKNLASVYARQGQGDQAEKLYLKSLSVANDTLGADSPYVATILGALSNLKQSQHKEAEAQKLAAQAAVINEKAFGNNKALLASLPDTYGGLTRAANYANSLDKIEASVKDVQVQTDASVQALTRETQERLRRKVRDKWALVIGISQFSDQAIDLKYAAKDAKDFAEYLIKEGNFAPDHVRLLLNEKATRENILSQLGDKWLPRVAGPDDLVVIYVSSHGSPSQADVAGVNYLVAYNTDKNSLLATGIPIRDMTSMVKDRIHSDRVVLIMDACHSGAAVESEGELASKGLFRVTNFSADEIFQGCGQLVICSSQPNQVSWESKEYPNGVFTHYLLEGLRKDGTRTTLADACQFMKDHVQNEVYKDRGALQTPVLKSKWRGNDLILSVPATSPQLGLPDDGATTPIAGGNASSKAATKSDTVIKAASKSTQPPARLDKTKGKVRQPATLTR
jgi:hypothetical protein